MVSNLIKDQYQIEDLIMGKGTQYRVNGFEIMPYNIAAGDYQLPRQDTNNFGFDQHSAQPINLTIQVMKNRWLLPHPAGAQLQSGSLSKLQSIWRGDGVRYDYGAMQKLYYCGNDGIIKEIYGRTGKFSYPRDSDGQEFLECTAEFRRADAFSYSTAEYAQEMLKGSAPTIVRVGGDAPTWGRILMQGPLTNPTVMIGENKFTLDIELDDDEWAEISSYPWRRRAVDGNGVNLRAYMSGIDYLDKMRLYNGIDYPVRWTSEEVNTWVPDLGNRDWFVDIDDLNNGTKKNVPDTFTTIIGKPVIRFDLLNFGNSVFPFLTPSKYIGSGIFGTTSACLYAKETYNSASQFCSARIVEPHWGRSGIVIMSNDTMTSGVMLEVTSGPFNNWLKIRNITGPTSYSAVRASWQNMALLGWNETDTVSIEYNPDTKTYTARFNGVSKCSWNDSGDIVPTGDDNRNQGFIFDLDGNLLTEGTGFKDILAYDMAVVPSPVGKVYFVWKNAYQVIQ